jgi:DNA polymerase-3 subunit alpha
MSPVKSLVDKAIANSMPAIALTDHGNMFGVKELFNYVKKKNAKTKEQIGDLKKELKENPDLSDDEKSNKQKQISELEQKLFKPIIGCECYVARREMTLKEKDKKEDRGGWHLILLAKNLTGYRNLCKLVSSSWIDGFYYKPRIDKNLLERYHEGLIVSSACLGGEIPQKLLGDSAKDVDDSETSSGYDDSITISSANLPAAEESIMWFKKIFGDDFYLEIQRHKTDKPGGDTRVYKLQQAVNPAILELAQRTNTKVIATNDSHFVEEEHAEAHDRLICLSTGKDMDDPKRMRYTKQEWLKTPSEMERIFADVPQALENTLEIAQKVEFYDIDSPAMMPVFEIPSDFGTEEIYRQKYNETDLRTEFGDERFEKLGGYQKVVRVKLEADYLTKLAWEGAEQRYGKDLNDEIQERIQFELDTMKSMGFPGYFLIVQDFINAARQMSISVGPGRGSAAGSVVAYCLKITDIDPLKYDLLFERFLNPDRISMPDIDIDFDSDGRGRVLQWVTEKYGKERVAHIITYGTMGAKSSIKDVARVQKLDLKESTRLANLIPDKFPSEDNEDAVDVTIKNCYSRIPEFQKEFTSSDSNVVSILKYAEVLEGTVRQTGVHACGVIIGADDLTNHVPISTAIDKETGEEVLVTQYEGSVIEEIGLIKMDFLALKNLDVIKEALKNIKKNRGIDLDIDKIPIDDQKTYKLYSDGRTIGTFQFESAGMQKNLKDLQPTQFEDLIAMNALFRPGPMKYIPSFINRKHGKEPITYDIPIMEKRLKDTYGITIYQEQVMLLSRDLAGFTRGQSDELRKAMGKKLKDKMASLETKFIKGATAKGYDEKVLQKIWNDWTDFAKYAFNKSHATCYSWVAYQTAYLKANYPAEFMAANLTRNRDSIADVSKFMDECKMLGINVLSPDVNESELNFAVNSNGDIRFGLGGIKGVGEAAALAIIDERQNNGKFSSIFNFVERINLSACNKKTLESLAFAGAFDEFPDLRREQLFTQAEKDGKTEYGFDESIMLYGARFQQDKTSKTNSLFGDMEEIQIPKPKLQSPPDWTNGAKLNKEREYVGIYLSSHPLINNEFELLDICNCNTADIKNLEELKGQSIRMGGIISDLKEAIDKNGKPYARFSLEDFNGTHEFMLFSDSYLKFKNFLIKDMRVYIFGKVQYRGDDWKFKPKDDKPKELEFKILKIDTLDKLQAEFLKQITLTIPLQNITPDFMVELSDLIINNKGKIALFLNIVNENGIHLKLLARKHSVDVNPKFYKAIKQFIQRSDIEKFECQ